MQCKDIPDLPVLEFLARMGIWCTHGVEYHMPSVARAMPPGTGERLQRAKMARLGRRGLVTGCFCGCRGDYEITGKGLEYLAEHGVAVPWEADGIWPVVEPVA